jgi:hypothetical protein
MQGVNPVIAEIETAKKIQRVKYWFTYTVTSTIANGSTKPLLLTIEQDADFQILETTISCNGPVNEDGTPIGTGATIGETPLTDFPLFGDTTQAVRGLTVQITDTGAGRLLTSGEIPVENIGTPAYGQQLYIPFKLKYLALRNTKLRFDVRNRDLATTTPTNLTEYHEITIGLHGFKYESYLGA